MRLWVQSAGLAAAALVASATPASAAYIFGPGAQYATTEGYLNNIVFNRDNTHTQWIFSSSLFGDAPLTINGFSLRFDEMVTNMNGNQGVFALDSSFAVKLATIDGLASSVFADNLGDAETVMSGARNLPWTIGGPDGVTKPWGVHLNFATPFDYDPTTGASLVIDLTVPAQVVYGTMDFVADYYTDPSLSSAGYRVYNGNAAATSGSLQSYTPVIRFDVSPQSAPVGGVPEPGVWALMLLGFGAAGAALRRRRVLA